MKTLKLLVLCSIKNAWNQITAMTIKNCSRKAGFTDDNMLEQIMPSDESDPEDDLPLCIGTTRRKIKLVSTNRASSFNTKPTDTSCIPIPTSGSNDPSLKCYIYYYV